MLMPTFGEHTGPTHAATAGRWYGPLGWLRVARLGAIASPLLALLFTAPLLGQQSEDPVQAGREALEQAADFPWYDAEQDQLQRLDVEPREDVSNRASRWERTERQWSVPDWVKQLFEVLAWAVLIGLLCLLVYFLVQAFMNYENRTAELSLTPKMSTVGEADRVEKLPFELKRTAQRDLLEEARALYEQGRYAEAIVYLYSYQLVQLDKHHLIRLAKGKTNRQYLREVRRQPTVCALLEQTMVVFEDVFFGNYPLDQTRFETCWNSLDRFHQQLGQASP